MLRNLNHKSFISKGSNDKNVARLETLLFLPIFLNMDSLLLALTLKTGHRYETFCFRVSYAKWPYLRCSGTWGKTRGNIIFSVEKTLFKCPNLLKEYSSSCIVQVPRIWFSIAWGLQTRTPWAFRTIPVKYFFLYFDYVCTGFS